MSRSPWRPVVVASALAGLALLAACQAPAQQDAPSATDAESEESAEISDDEDQGTPVRDQRPALAPPFVRGPREGSSHRSPAADVLEVDPVDAAVDQWLDDLDDEGRLGQLLMLRIYGGDIDEEDPRNEAMYGVATPREVVERYRPGGIILFRSDSGQDTGNLVDPQQVRQLTDDLREVSSELGPPVTVAIDQEGGKVDRIGHFGTPYPTARELEEDPEAAAEHAEVTIRELAALGVDMNFAPVADVDSEATNPIIGDRAYSADPEVVARMVLAKLDRYEGRPVVPGLKHFPGHGDTTADSHLTLPVVEADREQLATRELVPFEAAIEAGAQIIMTAHLEMPALAGAGVPVSMSEAVVTDLLRDELGFEGLIVTDSLEMAGARVDRPDERVALHALLAGHDLLVLPPVPDESAAMLARALDREQLPADRVEASVERLLRIKAQLHLDAEERPDPDTVGTGDAG